MAKQKIILAFILVLAVFIFCSLVYYFKAYYFKTEPVACTMEAKECSDGTFVSRIPPKCEFAPCPGEKEGILIFLPKRNEKIKSPLKIEGQAKGFWFFEAQFIAELFDDNGNLLGTAVLTAKDDWVTENFVAFGGNLEFNQPSVSSGKLKFLSANPSGLVENQRTFELPIQFEEISSRKVFLYYYNPEKDRDQNGNIKCSRDGLVAIEREIPVTKNPIQDTINLLLKGKENLTSEDIAQGITTEFPLEGLELKSVNFKKEGTLILEFNDPLAKTIGGACRVGILWFQIEATAKQFPGVKKVQFLPEEIFQP